ncbi:hypothetical protein L873DRAFT_815439 [Choiromyces venosus 120613-1]|uniref:Uncharacterized protein n=1 Tax=Choiromyces venosus 120613-1 TaxID=1336337 RepID=A0A3N4JT58_9PEZI|nr:hypothetical protein L873DRAFT_815439 [Choiromyces venosus 120613-1]
MPPKLFKYTSPNGLRRFYWPKGWGLWCVRTAVVQEFHLVLLSVLVVVFGWTLSCAMISWDWGLNWSESLWCTIWIRGIREIKEKVYRLDLCCLLSVSCYIRGQTKAPKVHRNVPDGNISGTP